MYIAHIPNMDHSIIEFHLNILAGDKIPRIGTKVYASDNNGHTGRIAKIAQIKGFMRFHASNGYGLHLGPFASVDYVGVIIE